MLKGRCGRCILGMVWQRSDRMASSGTSLYGKKVSVITLDALNTLIRLSHFNFEVAKDHSLTSDLQELRSECTCLKCLTKGGNALNIYFRPFY